MAQTTFVYLLYFTISLSRKTFTNSSMCTHYIAVLQIIWLCNLHADFQILIVEKKKKKKKLLKSQYN